MSRLFCQAANEPEVDRQTELKKALGSKKITCRLCQGDHYTTRCPFKETLGAGETDEADDLPADNVPAATPGGTGKYVPPSMRPEGRGGKGETMYGGRGSRDDLPTLRVTNLSEDVKEPDLWDLFGRFGHINRIYVGTDPETRLCKGYAFVSFDDRKVAEKAMAKIDGLPCTPWTLFFHLHHLLIGSCPFR